MLDPMEPVTLDEARAHLQLGTSPTPQDDYISSLITDAREFVESETDLVLVQREITETATRLGGWIELKSWPIQSIAAVRYPVGGVMTPLADGSWFYSLKKRPVRIIPAAPGWGVNIFPDPCGMAALPVEIDIVAGYETTAEVPARAKRAILMMIAHWFLNRSATEVGARAAAVAVPLAVQDLLERLRLQFV